MDTDSFFFELNDEQAEAVRHEGGPLLVLAGAGSGKTRVLTYRIAYLLTNGLARPHEIFAVTFTNKAAGEMQDRVRTLVGETAEGIWISTFHSACVRILRRDGELIGVPRGFVIYDEADQVALIKRLYPELGIQEKEFPPRQLAWMLDQSKNRMVDREAFAAGLPAHQQDHFLALAGAYNRAMREAGAVDFGDLLFLAFRLLDTQEEVRQRYQERFRHVLVDEFQDTNRAQYLLLNALLGDHRNLFVVGDDDQSIYSWRGAEIANILEFERDFPDTRHVVLTRNYRSTKRILDAATDVVVRNRGRKAKNLVTANPEGERVTYYRADDEYDEARFVVDRAVEMKGAGAIGSYGEIAVFYRTNAQSRVVEDELRRAGLPYLVIGGLRFYDRKEVKDALAYLRLVVNPADTVALLRIVNVPQRKIGNATVEKAVRLAQQLGLPLLEAIYRGVRGGSFPRGAARNLEGFLAIVDELRAAAEATGPSELLATALDRSGYRAMLEAEDTPESVARLENLEELRSALRQFEKTFPGDGIAAFLEQVALISDPDLYDERANAVSLMTLHCAKGLEFPVVFIVGMEDRLFPHQRSKNSEAELEEERRLCYVGFTRAREKLLVTNALRRNVFGSPTTNAESPFVADISPDLLDIVHTMRPALFSVSGSVRRRRSRQAVPGSAAPGSDEHSQETEWEEPVWGDPDDRADEWAVGTRLEHDDFGEGQVITRSGSGDDTRIAVRFDRGGVRTLQTKYAPIRKIGC